MEQHTQLNPSSPGELLMSGIVCAIRGGPSSQATIAQAIALAKETGLPLHFLYVVNLDFMSHTSSSHVQPVSGEMHQMGEFILIKAEEAAAEQGVRAQGTVRKGKVREEIAGLCHEIEAEYLVLGRPHIEGEDNIFTQALLTQFIDQIEQETGAQVVLLPEDGP
jgi:nucleotide-binding universal stress UspA family protein